MNNNKMAGWFGIIAVLFAAIVVYAATPDYKAFRGSGAVTVTTNPPTGTVVIHVEPGAAGITFDQTQFNTNGPNTALKDGALGTNFVSHDSLTARKAGVTGSIELKDSTELLSVKFLAPDNALSNFWLRLPKAGSNGIVTIAADEALPDYYQMTITPYGEIAWKSNLTVLAAKYIVNSNQIVFLPETNYNGGNMEYPGEEVTNKLDFLGSMIKPYTNVFTTHHTWLLTNMLPWGSAVITFKGNATTTNRFKIRAESGGTNVVWLNWPTNATHDIDVRPGFSYAVSLFVDGTGTNVQATVVTDDVLQPFKVNTFLAPVGYTRSNAILGGTIHKQIGGYTNLNADISVLTNLALWPITGHSLTNSGDEFTFVSRGKLLAGSNTFQVVMGNTTLLDTGTITNNATDYEITGSIVRTGDRAQQTFVRFRWGPGQGVYWPETNSFLVDAQQTNGIANTDLVIKGASRRSFGISNLFFSIDYKPAHRP